MRRAMVLVLGGVLLLGACGDGESGADTNAASTTDSAGEPIVIRTSVVGAATPGAEPIATGEVLEGPPLGARRSALAGPFWTPTEAPIPRWR